MRGFALDPLTHDLKLDAAGRLETLDGDAATYQEIKTRLLLLRGECFADLREGVPYFQEIFAKGTTPGRVKAILRQAILTHPAIVDVPILDIEIDRMTRAASVTFEARTQAGRVIRSGDFGPIVIE